jgi:predicted RNase H-like HicB family nuclease
MLTPYITAAMRHAHYELLPEDEGYYGEIPALEGVYATASTLDACREELQSVLEGWVMLGLAMGHPFPAVDGRELVVRRDAA